VTVPRSSPPPKERHTLRLILPFLWPEDDPVMKAKLLTSFGVVLAMAGLNSAFPMIFAEVIDTLNDKAGQSTGNAIGIGVLGLLIAYGAAHWLSRCFSEIRWTLYGRIEQPVRRKVNMVVFDHLHNLSLRFHLGKRTGSLSRIIDNGSRAIEDLLFDIVFLILPFIIEIVLVTNLLFIVFDGIFAVIMLGTLALYLTTLIIGSEWLRRHQRRAVAVGTEAHGKAVDSLLNFETIKYSGNERFVSRRYDDALTEVQQMTIKALTWRSLTGLINVSVLGVGITLMVVTAGNRVLEGAMTLGALVAVNQYLLQLIRPLDRLGHLYRTIKKALVDLEQMMSLLAIAPEIVDAPGAAVLPDGGGEIVFDHVGFAYDSRRPVLHDVSFTVPAGKTVALVGPSGAGKSTIARLLFRFYEATSGEVRVDGADITKTTQQSLRAAIAVVPQDSVLFNESLKYNIGFGRPGCTDEEIIEAARLAQIHDFIAALPDGYESLVGERGLKLSGGEKQRVAIARAALKRPRIFMFDEATSSLDSHTENAIQQNLRAISQGTTTLIIAHRLSTITHADEILFFEDGRIIERGSHLELLARDAAYAAMWRRQLETRDPDPVLAQPAE